MSAKYRGSGTGGSGGAEDASTRSTLVRAGLLASGITADYGVFWDDMQWNNAANLDGWFPNVVGTGSFAVNSAAFVGGLYRLTSGATASSVYRQMSLFSTIGPPGTSRWYMAWRMRLQTVPDAQTACGVGMWNTANDKTIMIGAYGAGSTSNFVVQYDGNNAGTFASTGVPLDTAFHVFELWGVGDGKVHSRVDGVGTDVNATLVSPATQACFPMMQAANGSTAAAQVEDVDYCLALHGRTP